MSSFDNLGSRHAEFSDSLLFRSGGNTVKKPGKIPPVKATIKTTNRGVSRQEDSEKQKGKSKIWDAVEVVSESPVYRPEVAFRESSKLPGVIELELPALSGFPITLFGEKKRKRRVIRRTQPNITAHATHDVTSKPRRHINPVSEMAIRTKENVEDRVYSDPDRKVPTYMFSFMAFVSFCIAAQHIDIMFGEIPSAMGDPGVATEAERQIESILMYEVIEDAAAMSPYLKQEHAQGLPSYQPDYYRSPEDIGAIGVGIIAMIAFSQLRRSDDND